jgi:hypothetical protein
MGKQNATYESSIFLLKNLLNQFRNQNQKHLISPKQLKRIKNDENMFMIGI